MTAPSSELRTRLARVREEIASTAERAGRANGVRLVAVTKTFPAEAVREAYHQGQRLFGENRVQEAVTKIDALQDLESIKWHLIGHLQTNKARDAIAHFTMVESVDSVRLAVALNERAARRAAVLPVLLEVNVAGESTKHGFSPEGLRQDVGTLVSLEHLELRGLMTVAPLVSDPEDVRPVFRHLRELRDMIRDHFEIEGFDQLSMGMSGDFHVAIEEGSTLVRLGRAIFGERQALTTRPAEHPLQ